MPAEVNCIFTKVLIPFVEREVGPHGVAAILRTAGRSRDYLVADHNWISLSVANELVRLAMELMREPDEERWARRYAEHLMDWKPSRADRSYLGAYAMGLGEPRDYFERAIVVYAAVSRVLRFELLEIGRNRARFRWIPIPGVTLPRWLCTRVRVAIERAPTTWGLPRAIVTETQCAASGADSCLVSVRWKNPPLSMPFWGSVVVGVAGSAILVWLLGEASWVGRAFATAMPALAGLGFGLTLRARVRYRRTRQMLDLQSEEIIYTNSELEKKFRDLEDNLQTIEELSRGLEDKVRVRTEQLRAANEELQAAYRDLQATQMQLVQREKMASVGQLVAGVAHELNNPVGFVFSNVSTLDDFVGRLRAMLDEYRRLELPEAVRRRIDERWAGLKVDYALKYLDSMIQGIREGAERARKIVGDLRVFARGQDEVWQAVDLHEELESSLTLLNHMLKDRVAVHRKFGELSPVECIRSQIDQVFLNLLANAAQAIQGSGEITIATRRDGSDALVTITDTGGGIPAEIIGRVFDPFFTTKPVGEGTGLGLSISYEIVKKHGGEIRAESPPGGGAGFTVRLPLERR